MLSPQRAASAQLLNGTQGSERKPLVEGVFWPGCGLPPGSAWDLLSPGRLPRSPRTRRTQLGPSEQVLACQIHPLTAHSQRAWVLGLERRLRFESGSP